MPPPGVVEDHHIASVKLNGLRMGMDQLADCVDLVVAGVGMMMHMGLKRRVKAEAGGEFEAETEGEGKLGWRQGWGWRQWAQTDLNSSPSPQRLWKG